MTKKQKYEKYTDESFKNIEELQNFFRNGGKLKYDYIIVGGILYTMHEYDMEGRYITWANKKHEHMIEITTSNRYGRLGMTDAEIIEYSPSYLREDISYAE